MTLARRRGSGRTRAAQRPALQRLGIDRLETDVALAPYTTFRIGGPADLLYRARTPDELAGAVTAARELGVPHFLLGLGANILVADAGFRGLVIRSEVERHRVHR
jgi:UDP-N-acetylmuramate dehydrogenase